MSLLWTSQEGGKILRACCSMPVWTGRAQEVPELVRASSLVCWQQAVCPGLPCQLLPSTIAGWEIKDLLTCSDRRSFSKVSSSCAFSSLWAVFSSGEVTQTWHYWVKFSKQGSESTRVMSQAQFGCSFRAWNRKMVAICSMTLGKLLWKSEFPAHFTVCRYLCFCVTRFWFFRTAQNSQLPGTLIWKGLVWQWATCQFRVSILRSKG